ncbi:hypothetical protein [Clostridium sp.]|uniref:hypothetical protein n=1 Tax=Clostridium sp. TaxID=1506 RepID=UPI0026159E3E|nr:hypothetical protein [Clostridium sp.]
MYYVVLITLPLIVIGVGFIAYNFYSDNQEEKEAKYEEKLFAIHDTMQYDIDTFLKIEEIYSDIFSSDNIADAERIEEKLKEDGIIEELEINQNYVNGRMIDLKRPPKKYKDMYDKMVALESAYNDIYDNYLLPAKGTYEDFVLTKSGITVNLAQKNAVVLEEKVKILKKK